MYGSAESGIKLQSLDSSLVMKIIGQSWQLEAIATAYGHVLANH